MFMDFVEKAKKKVHFELWNFMIMDNHIDFLIKPSKGISLSQIMQWIKGKMYHSTTRYGNA
ncbi:MAG: transposase [Treponema sp.]|jgi:REP element-mobilizing transposase RayT|nr:transposase [Treponema sp.]